jgi:hypothetical protein
MKGSYEKSICKGCRNSIKTSVCLCFTARLSFSPDSAEAKTIPVTGRGGT